MSTRDVLIAIPTYTGMLEYRLVHHIMNTKQSVSFQHHSPIDIARNVLVKKAFEIDCEWILWLDDDTVLPDNVDTVIDTLKSVKQPIVTGLTITNNGNKLVYNVRSRAMQTEKNLAGWLPLDAAINSAMLLEVESAGSSCMLVKREVYENLEYPWYTWAKMSGEDIYFCRQARDKGYKIMAHCGVICGHVKAGINLLDLVQP